MVVLNFMAIKFLVDLEATIHFLILLKWVLFRANFILMVALMVVLVAIKPIVIHGHILDAMVKSIKLYLILTIWEVPQRKSHRYHE
jgi:hypothetical protein